MSSIQCPADIAEVPSSGGRLTAKKSYVLLCSPAHSGSTLIACLGAAHPEISTVGEFSVFFRDTGTCSCGTPYMECEFWRRWIEIAAAAGISYSPGSRDFAVGPDAEPGNFARLYHYPFPGRLVSRIRDALMRHTSYHKRVQEKTGRIVRMAQLLCENEGTLTFLDTSKNGLQARTLFEQDAMPVRYISLVRDGRAAVLSFMKWYNYSLEEAVDRWLSQVRLLQRTVSYAPADKVLHLRHEDFVQKQQSTIPRLYEFCGVDSSVPLDFSRHRRHIVGNTMRHNFDGTIRMDESWRSKITSEQLNFFNQRAGRVNRSLGYED
jgi:hypothetical protein